MPSTTKDASSKAVTQAGMSLQSGGDANPNPIQHGSMGQAERAFSAASTFLSGIMAILASQFIGTPLKILDSKSYDAYMAWTKESFAVLVTTITQWWAPTVIRVSGDDSMKGQLFLMKDETLRCNFPHRLVLMGNHQLYTDWLYLWWIAYTNKMHGRIYIILKESLKRVPIVGWGMQFYNFIFLSRKWEQDQLSFKRNLQNLKNPEDPMWLLIFPEGTNLSAVTREKSARWAEKNGIEDMKHQLLPRTTGLKFCLQELQASVNWLYDCTIAYEGVPQGTYGQDIFTLRSSFFEGRPPKSVNMYWRRFKIAEIPHADNDQFSMWLMNRWREKDYILEYYNKFGSFPAEEPSKAVVATRGNRKSVHAKTISTSVKGGGWNEFLNIFEPITSAASALSNVDMTGPFHFDEVMRKLVQPQQYIEETISKSLFVAKKESEHFRKVSQKLTQTGPQTKTQVRNMSQSSKNPQVTEKVSRTIYTNKASRNSSERSPANTFKQSKEVATKTPPKCAISSSSVSSSNKAIPLANMNSMITKPISTVAVHAVGQKLISLAAKQTRNKGASFAKDSVHSNQPTKPSIPAGHRSRGVVRKPTSTGSSIDTPPPSEATARSISTSTTPTSANRAPLGSTSKPATRSETTPRDGGTARNNSAHGRTKRYQNGKQV